MQIHFELNIHIGASFNISHQIVKFQFELLKLDFALRFWLATLSKEKIEENQLPFFSK